MKAPLLALAGAGLALSACVSDPYPIQGSVFLSPDSSIGANRAPRGSDAFCRRYAQQTQDNFFEANSDAEDSFGSNALVYQQARRSGDGAYERCRRGRTN
ncbi:hypothetical protein [Aureimonas leprariae]|uniref:Lipoprotein n=1 Tax=Plantimonas leprariae TaxID=2615207 RepID=A0A7V7PT86_9HYPH|nr:hypothetical protein [Aureimonas leprariae]KAB0682813.1 hypothetical protein F6X38_01650 [Aureimonas leprariae]